MSSTVVLGNSEYQLVNPSDLSTPPGSYQVIPLPSSNSGYVLPHSTPLFPVDSSRQGAPLVGGAMKADAAARQPLLKPKTNPVQAWKKCFDPKLVDRFIPIEDQDKEFTNEQEKALFLKIYFSDQWIAKYGAEVVNLFIKDPNEPLDVQWVGKQLSEYEKGRRESVEILKRSPTFSKKPHLALFDDEAQEPSRSSGVKSNRPLFDDDPKTIYEELQSDENAMGDFVDTIAIDPNEFIKRAGQILDEYRSSVRNSAPYLERNRDLIVLASKYAPLSERAALYTQLETEKLRAAKFTKFLKGEPGQEQDKKFIVEKLFPHYASGEMELTPEIREEILYILWAGPLNRETDKIVRGFLGLDRIDGSHKRFYNQDALNDQISRQMAFQKYYGMIKERGELEQISLKAKREKKIFDYLIHVPLDRLLTLNDQLAKKAQDFIEQLLKKAAHLKKPLREVLRNSSALRVQAIQMCQEKIAKLDRSHFVAECEAGEEELLAIPEEKRDGILLKMYKYGKCLFIPEFKEMHEGKIQLLKELSTIDVKIKNLEEALLNEKDPDQKETLEASILALRSKIVDAFPEQENQWAKRTSIGQSEAIAEPQSPKSALPNPHAKFDGVYVMALGDILYRVPDKFQEEYVEGKWVIADLQKLSLEERALAVKLMNKEWLERNLIPADPSNPSEGGRPVHFKLERGKLVPSPILGNIMITYASPSNLKKAYDARELGTQVRFEKQDGIYKHRVKSYIGSRDLDPFSAAVDSQISILTSRELMVRFMNNQLSFQNFRIAMGSVFAIHQSDLAKMASFSESIYQESHHFSTNVYQRKMLDQINHSIQSEMYQVELKNDYDPLQETYRINGLHGAIGRQFTWSDEIDKYVKQVDEWMEAHREQIESNKSEKDRRVYNLGVYLERYKSRLLDLKSSFQGDPTNDEVREMNKQAEAILTQFFFIDLDKAINEKRNIRELRIHFQNTVELIFHYIRHLQTEAEKEGPLDSVQQSQYDLRLKNLEIYQKIVTKVLNYAEFGGIEEDLERMLFRVRLAQTNLSQALMPLPSGLRSGQTAKVLFGQFQKWESAIGRFTNLLEKLPSSETMSATPLPRVQESLKIYQERIDQILVKRPAEIEWFRRPTKSLDSLKQHPDQVAQHLEAGTALIEWVSSHKDLQASLFFLNLYFGGEKSQALGKEIFEECGDPLDWNSFRTMMYRTSTFLVNLINDYKGVLSGNTGLSEEFFSFFSRALKIRQDLNTQELLLSFMTQKMLSQPPKDPTSLMRYFPD